MPIRVNLNKVDSLPRISQFSTPCGDETYITLEVEKSNDAGEDFKSLLNQYSQCLARHGLSHDTEVYIRFYLNEISSEASALRLCLKERNASTFYSLIGQSPASGGRVSLEAYHIKSDTAALLKEDSGDELLIHHGTYKSLWMRTVSKNSGSPEQQTKEMFTCLSDKLGLNGSRLKDDVIRTWCYVNDIYENYNGFVNARMEYFASIGMTEETHTIASTGIEASHEDDGRLLSIDSLALPGLDPAQIEYLTALDNMPPTYKYNVTFERGTKITYGDRTHLYISGTASIDKKGNVLYPGDIENQTYRTLENIQSLLLPHGAEISDMKILIVYLRDDIACDKIRKILGEAVPEGLPRVIVQGNVCRRSWLVEMEGIAILKNSAGTFAPFC